MVLLNLIFLCKSVLPIGSSYDSTVDSSDHAAAEPTLFIIKRMQWSGERVSYGTLSTVRRAR
jgi:hypothetical protein